MIKPEILSDEELDDCYFNPPTTIANEFQDYRVVNRHICQTTIDYCYKEMLGQFVNQLEHIEARDKELRQDNSGNKYFRASILTFTKRLRHTLQSQLEEA